MKFLAIIILTFLFSIYDSQQFSLVLTHIEINRFAASLTVPLDESFTRIPDFTYALQSIYVQRAMFSLDCQITSATSRNINLALRLQTYFLGLILDIVYVQVPLLFIEGEWIEGGVVNIPTGGPSFHVFKYARQHRYNSPLSYSLSIFGVAAPFTYTINSMDSFSFNLTFVNRPFAVGGYLLNFTVTYLVVEKIFTARQVFVPFTLITESIFNFVLQIDLSGSILPSSTNTFIGINQLDYSGAVLQLFKLALYNQLDPITSQPIMKIGFKPTITPLVKLRGSFINFNILNQDSKLCPSNYYIAYRNPFINLPMSCNQCDKTCQTCASWEHDSNYTNSSFCVTCADYRYFTPYQNYKFGSCQCLKGLIGFPDGTCSTCQFNCLEFEVNFISSNHRGAFLFTLTYTDVTHEIEFQKNLDVEVDGTLAQYALSKLNGGAYEIIIEPTYLKACEKNCKLVFRVKYPSRIKYYNNTYLTVQSRTRNLSNYYLGNVGTINAANMASQVISKVVTISASTNFFQFVKFLFELEQVIEIHKYLDLQLPIYFNQFVSSLESFRFLDFTVFFPDNVADTIRSTIPNDLDTKGSPKLIYYEKGTNFVKNMVKLMLSLVIIFLTNLVTFGLFALLACIAPVERVKKFFKRATKVIKLRWFITISDYVQSTILPISIFGFFQFNYIVFKPSLFWIYAFAFIMNSFAVLFCFFFLPFIFSQKSEKNRVVSIFDKKKYQFSMLNKEAIEDMLQDCVLSRVAILFYCYGFMKKFLFGIILGNPMNGFIQIFLMFFLNISHVTFLIYIFKKDRYKSKVKMFSRTASLLSIITLQSLIAAYNMIPMSPSTKVYIGNSCIWVSFIGSAGGIVDAVIKFKDIFSQKIYESQFIEEKERERKQKQNQNTNAYFKNLFTRKFQANLMNPKKINQQIFSEVSQFNNYHLYISNENLVNEVERQPEQEYRQQIDGSASMHMLVESEQAINGESNTSNKVQQYRNSLLTNHQGIQRNQAQSSGEKENRKNSESSQKIIFEIQQEDEVKNNNNDDAVSKDSDIIQMGSTYSFWEPKGTAQIRPNTKVKRIRQKNNINSTKNSLSTNYLTSDDGSLKNQNIKKNSGDTTTSNYSSSTSKRKNNVKKPKQRQKQSKDEIKVVQSTFQQYPIQEQRQENVIYDDAISNNSQIVPLS